MEATSSLIARVLMTGTSMLVVAALLAIWTEMAISNQHGDRDFFWWLPSTNQHLCRGWHHDENEEENSDVWELRQMFQLLSEIIKHVICSSSISKEITNIKNVQANDNDCESMTKMTRLHPPASQWESSNRTYLLPHLLHNHLLINHHRCCCHRRLYYNPCHHLSFMTTTSYGWHSSAPWASQWGLPIRMTTPQAIFFSTTFVIQNLFVSFFVFFDFHQSQKAFN